ncbi:MAG: dockerin type I domain-containing protein, partial [Candidatus Paceibacterota bacterium]
IENLQNKVAPGTCIQCGFENVINLIKTSDKSTEYASGQKRVAVVLLTDGNPNYKEKDPRTAESIRIIKKLTDNLKDGEDDLPKTTIATIGYGDPNATDNPGRVFYTNLQNWASKGFCYGTGEVDNKCTKKDNVGEVYVKVASDLNACYAQEQEFAQLLRATDLNGDGIVNSVDFFFVLDLYFARGEAITKGMQEAGLNNSPDINGDEVINSLDLSLVIERIGFTIASK